MITVGVRDAAAFPRKDFVVEIN